MIVNNKHEFDEYHTLFYNMNITVFHSYGYIFISSHVFQRTSSVSATELINNGHGCQSYTQRWTCKNIYMKMP